MAKKAMPTNLPAEAKAKWLKVMEARSIEEKVVALEEFISSVPKHKGTENLLRWATRRLSQLREELEEKKRKRVSSGPRFFVEKDGAAQVVMLGPPSSGKTSLLARLTNAKVCGSPIPFSTRFPTPGMMAFEDVLIQLVDTPSIPFGQPEKVSWYAKTIGLARNADGLLLVVDLSKDVEKQLFASFEELEDNGILLGKPRCKVTVTKTSGGGINVVMSGRLHDATVDDVKKLLLEYRVYHAVVKIYGEATIDDVEAAVLGHREYKPVVIVGNKTDVAEQSAADAIRDFATKKGLPFVCVSALRGDGLAQVPGTVFRMLDLIRVYTKEPSGEVSNRPLVLKRGATVLDVAQAVHSKVAENLRYARVWGRSVKHPGERVGKNHVLEDGDVVELRA